MLKAERRDPRAPGDRRMYLYFDYSESRSLRWYVKVSRKGRRIGLADEYGTPRFDAGYEAGVAALGGVLRMRRLKCSVKPDQPQHRYPHVDVNQPGQKPRQMRCQRNEARAALPTTTARPRTLRWYWSGYKQSDHWLGDLSVGLQGLAKSTRLQRTGLIESLLLEIGEKTFAVLTRKVIKAQMKVRTPSQAGNLLSALRGMIRWMIDEGHLDEDGDPTIGLRSGKAKASRESGGFVPWSEEDMVLYRAKWPLGTEARLMFDILHYTFLRLGDAYCFGPPHLRQILGNMTVQVATEKSRGNTTVTVPVHPAFAESLRVARAAGIVGAEVFAGKIVRGRVLPMNKKAWAAKFKKYAVLADVNQPKKSCHGIRKARAEVAAYADCTESQMMAMFGWTDPKMPAYYIAEANRKKLGFAGMDKIVAFDKQCAAVGHLSSQEAKTAFSSLLRNAEQLKFTQGL